MVEIKKRNKNWIWVKTNKKLKNVNFKVIEKGVYKIPLTPRNLFELGEQFPKEKKFKELQLKEEKYLASIKEKTWGLAIKSLINNEDKVLELKEKLESKIDLLGDFFRHQILSIYFGTIFPSAGIFLKMGLGKTYCAINIMKFRMFHSGVRRTWIITPKSLIPQWEEQIEKFFPELKNKILSVYDLSQIRGKDLNTITANVVIVNYEKILKILDRLNSVDMLILDESTLVKNYRAKRTKAALYLSEKVRFKLVLTGTPMMNNPDEVWSQYYIINPYCYNMSYYAFRGTYFYKPKDSRNWKFRPSKAKYFKRLLYTQAIRFKHEEVPEYKGKKIVKYCPVSLNPQHREIYNDTAMGVIDELERLKGYSITKGLPILGKLRQITSGFLILNKKDDKGKLLSKVIKLDGESNKINYVCTLAERAVKEGNSVVIAVNFVHTGKIIRKTIEGKGIKTAIIYGQQNAVKRKENEMDFKRGKVKVMISQLRTGGLGLDFKNANVVIFAEEDYSPKVNEQAAYRIVRLVQKKKCFIFFVYTKDTIDEKILFGTVKNKEQLINSIVETIKD